MSERVTCPFCEGEGTVAAGAEYATGKILAYLRARLAKAEAERDRAEALVKHLDRKRTEAELERNALRERLAAAVDTLLKYGQHLYDCDGRRHSNYACDCGFKAALAKAEGREVTP